MLGGEISGSLGWIIGEVAGAFGWIIGESGGKSFVGVVTGARDNKNTIPLEPK